MPKDLVYDEKVFAEDEDESDDEGYPNADGSDVSEDDDEEEEDHYILWTK